MQAAPAGIEPETRYGGPQEPGKGNYIVRFIGHESASRLAFLRRGPGKNELCGQFFERKIELAPKRLKFLESHFVSAHLADRPVR